MDDRCLTLSEQSALLDSDPGVAIPARFRVPTAARVEDGLPSLRMRPTLKSRSDHFCR